MESKWNIPVQDICTIQPTPKAKRSSWEKKPTLMLVYEVHETGVGRGPPNNYTPGSGEHGPRFLTGGPGAAPGGVASKNGWVYMRVQRGVISYSRESLSVLCLLSVVTKQPLVSKMGCAIGCAFAMAGRGINSAA